MAALGLRSPVRARRRLRYSPHRALALLLLGVAACGPSVDSPERGAARTAGDEATGESRGVVLFLGDSLSAGYGLRADQAFPALVQARIEEAGLPFRVVNAGVSGDTTAGGLRRLGWLLRQPVAVLVIQLGGNDMLRGQDLGAMRANLRGIAERAREAYPDLAIVLCGMEAPRNLGADYARDYRESFEALAAELDATYLPFLLDGVAAQPALNQADGIHPTAEGHEIVAENVWGVLAPVLRGRS